MTRRPPAKDWDRHQVMAALKRAGKSLAALSRDYSLHHTSLRTALYKSAPRCEAIIADALGMRPEAIWPSRYTPEAIAANPWRQNALARLGHPASAVDRNSSELKSKHKELFSPSHSTERAAGCNDAARVAA